MKHIDKANQGDLAPVELKDRRAKAMQDLDIGGDWLGCRS